MVAVKRKTDSRWFSNWSHFPAMSILIEIIVNVLLNIYTLWTSDIKWIAILLHVIINTPQFCLKMFLMHYIEMPYSTFLSLSFTVMCFAVLQLILEEAIMNFTQFRRLLVISVLGRKRLNTCWIHFEISCPNQAYIIHNRNLVITFPCPDCFSCTSFSFSPLDVKWKEKKKSQPLRMNTELFSPHR